MLVVDDDFFNEALGCLQLLPLLSATRTQAHFTDGETSLGTRLC